MFFFNPYSSSDLTLELNILSLVLILILCGFHTFPSAVKALAFATMAKKKVETFEIRDD